MSKKIISFTLVLALALSIFTFPASADDPIRVYLDGALLAFDVPPRLMNDRTMVPLRAVFEAMGAHVDWDGATETVTGTKGDTVVVLTIGDTSRIAYRPAHGLTTSCPEFPGMPAQAASGQ